MPPASQIAEKIIKRSVDNLSKTDMTERKWAKTILYSCSDKFLAQDQTIVMLYALSEGYLRGVQERENVYRKLEYNGIIDRNSLDSMFDFLGNACIKNYKKDLFRHHIKGRKFKKIKRIKEEDLIEWINELDEMVETDDAYSESSPEF